ncbi:hypothetical protein RvY_10469 [Ramazzottius varieornatus]|uniref:BHLH domain-containing protein n=1 Tax=Ramazzottius varieornatus TaxID=947166 RepID=A0A1D1VCW3_RAMVA|nr:hypothetical protein RvY_10469 [Ramazzottius varieornatus]
MFGPGTSLKNSAKTNAASAPRNQSLNLAFQDLRRLIPTEPISRKLSKIETLYLASSYICHLHAVLHRRQASFGSSRPDETIRNGPTFTCGPTCTFCVSSKRRKT